MRKEEPEREMNALDASKVPDRVDQANGDISKEVFWDSVAVRPFQITAGDIAFARDLGALLPHTYYMRRLQENFRLIPFDGTLRETTCGNCKKRIQTSLPSIYDGRILCEDYYLKAVY